MSTGLTRWLRFARVKLHAALFAGFATRAARLLARIPAPPGFTVAEEGRMIALLR